MKNTILILLLIFTISNCKRDRCSPNYTPGNKIDSLKISDSVKAELPDIKNDSFWYASNNGDTAILVCTEKKVVYTEELYQDLGSADCPKKWFRDYESILFSYTSSNKNLSNVKILVYRSKPPEQDVLVITFNEIYASITWDHLSYFGTDSIVINGENYSGYFLNQRKALFNKKLGIIRLNESNEKSWQLFK